MLEIVEIKFKRPNSDLTGWWGDMYYYNEGIVTYQKSIEMSRYLCVSKSGKMEGHLEQTEDALT